MKYDLIMVIKDSYGNIVLYIVVYKGYLVVMEVLINEFLLLILVVNNEGDMCLYMVVFGFVVFGFKWLDR